MIAPLIAALLGCVPAPAEPPPNLEKYNVVWTTPSKDASGSMPLGNGVVGVNAWVEENGDLVFYISRVDSWSECERLLKLGRIRVSMDPPLFSKPGASFRQELRLRDGEIAISTGDGTSQAELLLYVERQSDVIVISGRSQTPVHVSATLENWRQGERTLDDPVERQSSWAMRDAPSTVPREMLTESADVTIPAANAVAWFHRNTHSIVPFTTDREGLTEIRSIVPDPLLDRTSGGWMVGENMVSNGPGSLRTANAADRFALRIAASSEQTSTPEEWARRTRQLAEAPMSNRDWLQISLAANRQWWREFWTRSWIFVENDSAALNVPRNAHPLRFGADSNGQNQFHGLIGRASIFSRPLSVGEVGSISRPGQLNSTPDLTGLVSSWRFRPASGGGGLIRPVGEKDLTAKPTGDAGFFAREGDLFGLLQGGRFEVGDDDALWLPKGFTLEAWIKPDPECGPARIFDKMTAGGSDGFIFDTHPGDSLRLIVGDVTVHARGVLKRGQWQHVAATFDPETGRAALYLDGALVKENMDARDDTRPVSRVTLAYALQRFMQACASRGDFPIKFNGSIFTVEPRFTEGQPFNADWRKWGGSFWWQNTRLPYYPMLAAGDFDGMNSLFSFYERCLPACRARAKLYYNADGVYFPETMTTFATYANGDYGWNRDGLDRSDISPCPWWQFAWQQGLELSQIMLDYASYTGDDAFLRERAIPMASESLRYYDSRFARDDRGKLIISPTQAVETYWKGVVNDAPSVAGLHAVCDALLALPEKFGSPEDRALWKRMKAASPDLPVMSRDGTTQCAPAERFDPQRSNCETPELYSLFPFRLYGVGRPNLQHALAAYRNRHDKATHGWTQDGMFAAMLGLTDEAKSNLLAKCRNTNKNFRFPAMWGPNFDWLPDQCHGGNLMTTTQLMLMQCYDDRVYLLPAWPREWNVSFKLHAPGQTTVECVYRDGAVQSLRVTPESRRKDIVLPAR